MDHRWGRRQQTQFSTLLYEQGIPVATGKIKNLGKGGIFVELLPGACPRTRTVDVEIRVSSGSQQGRHRFHVLILRRSKEGVGMMFRDLNAEDEDLVLSLMNSDDTSAKVMNS